MAVKTSGKLPDEVIGSISTEIEKVDEKKEVLEEISTESEEISTESEEISTESEEISTESEEISTESEEISTESEEISTEPKEISTEPEKISTFEEQLKFFLETLFKEEAKLKPQDFVALTSADHAYFDWNKASKKFKRLKPKIKELKEKHLKLVQKLAKRRIRIEGQIRNELLSHLFQQAKKTGFQAKKLSDRPLTILFGELILTINFVTAKVTYSFGKEKIMDLLIDAKNIVEKYHEILREIKRELLDEKTFFSVLERAYRIVLIEENLSFGERVDLVDLAVPIAMIKVSKELRRKKNTKALMPFPHFLFAYQFWLLRKKALLEQNGLRINLGSATGGSTKVKHNVLYLPNTPSTGQYYLSIQFIPVTASKK